MAVDVAYDGREAAAKLDLSPYQVVVLDRDIPGLHGDTLCRMIADSGNPAMVLMLTAAGTPATGSPASAWEPTTTCPSRSTSPNWSSGSAPWPAASQPPALGLPDRRPGTRHHAPRRRP